VQPYTPLVRKNVFRSAVAPIIELRHDANLLRFEEVELDPQKLYKSSNFAALLNLAETGS
jgi:hypothetical protein